MVGADEKYWAEYDGLQHVKHQLLRSYLNGWFPILSSWMGRVLYIDCHAGRGRHDTGQEGSPILALRLLLNHRHRDQILANTEVHFWFFENNPANYDYLRAELRRIGDLPSTIKVVPISGDYEKRLKMEFSELRARGGRPAPSFAFVDPYGFSISMKFLNEILSFPTTELLVNFMYRYVDMALQDENQTDNMDILFGCREWRDLAGIRDSGERSERTINLFSRQLRAKYVTHLYMRGENSALKYVLFHATNHRAGREKMKEAMWSVVRDGSFTASERNSPGQLVLLVPEPNLGPLEDDLWKRFAGQAVRYEDICAWLVDSLYLRKHLHQILRCYRKCETIEVSGYGERFSFRGNPLFTFPPNRPSSSA